MGHRDSTPEDPDEFHAWAENYVKVMRENHERWGMPLEVAEISQQYFSILEEEMREEDAVPVEPDPIDGYTIYWNKKKRLFELMCECLDMPWEDGPGIGIFDGEIVVKRFLHTKNGLSQWKDFLADRVRKTGKRYGMSSEWAEKIITRVKKTSKAPKDNKENDDDKNEDSNGMEQQFLFVLCQAK